MGADLSAGAAEEYCYLTTTGRRTGRAHTIEIWFAVIDGRAYLLAGGGEAADWVRNLRAGPERRWRPSTRAGPKAGRSARGPGPPCW